MIERGILFSAKMVRALLDGRKTQTRRPVTLPSGYEFDGISSGARWVDGGPGRHISVPTRYLDRVDAPRVLCSRTNGPTGERDVYCPYGVRETWRTYASLNHLAPGGIGEGAGVQYEAGGSNVHGHPNLCGMGKRRPGIFMPRWMSRLTLDITQVRVQQAHDISVDDVYAEGVDDVCFKRGADGQWQGRCMTPQQVFGQLWDSINSRRPGKRWADNPLVWAITFRVVPQSNSQCHEATT